MDLLVEKEEELADIVRAARVVAVVGAKDGSRPDAPAYTIPKWLQSLGIRVHPVNPKFTTILGETVYPSIADVPGRPDIIDVFRRPEFVEALADEVLALPAEQRAPVFWMQTGIENAAAAKKLTAAGIRVVQDRCLGVYAERYRKRV